ncbi:MAG: hypothetical protein ACTH5X_17165, partial [Vibrio casei]
ETLADAREWILNFVNWYNNEHHHSAIKFVTPAERHRNLDTTVLAKRHTVYQQAKASILNVGQGRLATGHPLVR